MYRALTPFYVPIGIGGSVFLFQIISSGYTYPFLLLSNITVGAVIQTKQYEWFFLNDEYPSYNSFIPLYLGRQKNPESSCFRVQIFSIIVVE